MNNEKFYLGLDIGSVSVKSVIMDENKEIVDVIYIKNTGLIESITNIFSKIDKSLNICSVGITGSGKEFINMMIGGDIIESEIIAHAIATQHFHPDVKTIFDIGGEDCKLMSIMDGIIQHFAMNRDCILPTDEVITPNFIPKQIQDIRIGDKVMTHKGQFKKVKRVIKRKHNGLMYHIKAGSFKLNVTENHPIFVLKREQELDSEPQLITPDKVKEDDFVIQTMPHNYPIEKNLSIMKNKYGYLRRITSIKKEHYEGNVHNLTVKDHNTYVCNKIAISNCGGGTGAMIESIARRMGIDIEDVGDIALRSKTELLLPSKCGIFVQSSVVSKLNKGFPKEDILMGVCRGMIGNFLTMLAKGIPLEPPYVFQGATAQNKALVKCFEEELKAEVIVPKHCQFMGAIGMAILAKEHIEKQKCKTNFKGTNITELNFKTKTKIVKGCSNNCEVTYIFCKDKLVGTLGNKCEKCGGKLENDQ